MTLINGKIPVLNLIAKSKIFYLKTFFISEEHYERDMKNKQSMSSIFFSNVARGGATGHLHPLKPNLLSTRLNGVFEPNLQNHLYIKIAF